MNCKHCHNPIVLVPSAAQRAARDITGKTAEYFEKLFDYHSECTLELRRLSVSNLMRENRERQICPPTYSV
jgi:hypothetical protein